MSFGATPESPIPHDEAWPIAARQQYVRAVLDRAMSEGWLGKIKPGHLAPTGITKVWVLDEIAKRSELGGSAK